MQANFPAREKAAMREILSFLHTAEGKGESVALVFRYYNPQGVSNQYDSMGRQ